MLDYIAFLSCLEFAVLNSENQNTIFKPKQVICLENVYFEKDVICVLPTGYGKSLIFQLLPMLLFAKFKLCGDLILSWRSRGISTAVADSIVIVVSPLNSLMSDQVYRLSMSGIRSSIINVKEASRDRMVYDSDENNVDFKSNAEIDFSLFSCLLLCLKPDAFTMTCALQSSGNFTYQEENSSNVTLFSM